VPPGGPPAAPPGYAAPPGAAYPQQPATGQPGIAVAALVLGILSVLFGFLCGIFGVPLPIAGVVCGIIGRNQAQERGVPTNLATWGLALSIIGGVLSLLFLAIGAAIWVSAS
jgi:hypothetical protein